MYYRSPGSDLAMQAPAGKVQGAINAGHRCNLARSHNHCDIRAASNVAQQEQDAFARREVETERRLVEQDDAGRSSKSARKCDTNQLLTIKVVQIAPNAVSCPGAPKQRAGLLPRIPIADVSRQQAERKMIPHSTFGRRRDLTQDGARSATSILTHPGHLDPTSRGNNDSCCHMKECAATAPTSAVHTYKLAGVDGKRHARQGRFVPQSCRIDDIDIFETERESHIGFYRGSTKLTSPARAYSIQSSWA